MAPTMLEDPCTQIQHYCATLRRSRNKRNVGHCWLISLTGFKLCTTTTSNAQQHATGCANGRNTQHPTNAGSCCPTMLHSFAWGLRKEFIDPKTVWDTNMDAVLLFWDTNMVEVTSCKKAYATALLKSF